MLLDNKGAMKYILLHKDLLSQNCPEIHRIKEEKLNIILPIGFFLYRMKTKNLMLSNSKLTIQELDSLKDKYSHLNEGGNPSHIFSWVCLLS